MHRAATALGIEKQQTVKEFDFVSDANTAVEVFEVRAAAEGDVLAVVDVFAVGQHVGSSAAAEERTLFE
jgi:hypothetical protein